MRLDIRTVIVPAAGLGKSFGPATRTVPHALLPVIDTPLIQFALDEARAAKPERVVVVTRPQDAALHDYVADAAEGSDVEILLAVQAEPTGLGDAVLAAAALSLPGPVGVVLPDDLILDTPCLPELVERYRRSGAGHMVAVAEVEPGAVSSYAVLDPLERPRGGVMRAVGIVEKPSPEDAPSRLAVAGRYVLHPRIFADLSRLRARHAAKPTGRVELTRAIAHGIDGIGLAGSPIRGRWFDCGTPRRAARRGHRPAPSASDGHPQDRRRVAGTPGWGLAYATGQVAAALAADHPPIRPSRWLEDAP